MIQNCNCTELVDCECSLEFSSYQTGTTSVLDVGTLVATGCTITGYVIDWYKEGELVLVSASAQGLTPEATVFHPFTGSAAIPVLDGTYHPEVRFVVIGGDKVFTSERPCQKWCEMEIDLPDITVNALTCATTGGSPATGYDFAISYVATQDWTMSGRKIRYVLPTDGSVINFAVYFQSFLVADKISIYYNDDTSPLFSIVVGNQGGGSMQFSTMPYRNIFGEYKFVVGLPEYAEGDYLIIEIVPSVLETSYQTNWNAHFKCLTDSTVFEYDYFDDANLAYDIDNMQFTFDSVNCRYTLEMPYSDLVYVAGSANIAKYGGINNGAFGGGSLSYSLNKAYLFISDAYTNTYQSHSNSSGTKANRNKVTISKSGAVISIVCTNATEYAHYKDSLVAIQNSTFYTGWVNDNTDRRYYGYYYMSFYRSGSGGCGDSEASFGQWFFVGWAINYDDANKTITITTSTITNGLTSGGACDGGYSWATGMVGTVNGTAGSGNYTYDSYCNYSVPFYYGTRLTTTLVCAIALTTSGGFACYFNGDKSLPETFDATMQVTMFGIGYWGFWQFYLRLDITATRNSDCTWATDPLDNFRVYSYLDPITNLYTATPVLIYEKSGGTVTTKRYYGT
jgi:hypothetical protein